MGAKKGLWQSRGGQKGKLELRKTVLEVKRGIYIYKGG